MFPQLWEPPFPSVQLSVHWGVSSSFSSPLLLFFQSPAHSRHPRNVYNYLYPRLTRTCQDWPKGCPLHSSPNPPTHWQPRMSRVARRPQDSSGNVFHNLVSSEGFGNSLNSQCAFGHKHSACQFPACLLKASINQPSWPGGAGQGSPRPPGCCMEPLGAAGSGPVPPSCPWAPAAGRSWPLRQQLLFLPPGLGPHLHLATSGLIPTTFPADCAGAGQFPRPPPPSLGGKQSRMFPQPMSSLTKESMAASGSRKSEARVCS